MEYVCQIQDGYMLVKNGETFKVERTGYPYPNTELPNYEMLQKTIEDVLGVRKPIEFYICRWDRFKKYAMYCQYNKNSEVSLFNLLVEMSFDQDVSKAGNTTCSIYNLPLYGGNFYMLYIENPASIEKVSILTDLTSDILKLHDCIVGNKPFIVLIDLPKYESISQDLIIECDKDSPIYHMVDEALIKYANMSFNHFMITLHMIDYVSMYSGITITLDTEGINELVNIVFRFDTGIFRTTHGDIILDTYIKLLNEYMKYKYHISDSLYSNIKYCFYDNKECYYLVNKGRPLIEEIVYYCTELYLGSRINYGALPETLIYELESFEQLFIQQYVSALAKKIDDDKAIRFYIDCSVTHTFELGLPEVRNYYLDVFYRKIPYFRSTLQAAMLGFIPRNVIQNKLYYYFEDFFDKDLSEVISFFLTPQIELKRLPLVDARNRLLGDFNQFLALVYSNAAEKLVFDADFCNKLKNDIYSYVFDTIAVPKHIPYTLSSLFNSEPNILAKLLLGSEDTFTYNSQVTFEDNKYYMSYTLCICVNENRYVMGLDDKMFDSIKGACILNFIIYLVVKKHVFNHGIRFITLDNIHVSFDSKTQKVSLVYEC